MLVLVIDVKRKHLYMSDLKSLLFYLGILLQILCIAINRVSSQIYHDKYRIESGDTIHSPSFHCEWHGVQAKHLKFKLHIVLHYLVPCMGEEF